MASKREILDLAMEAELAALEQYLEMARRVQERGAVDMFVHLAHDELVHYKILKAELSPLVNKRSLEESRKTLDKILDNLPESSRPSRTPGRQHLEALKFAVGKEREAEAIYRKQAEEESNQEMKDIWLGLASMEKGHASVLQAQIDSIEDSGFWMEISSNWNVM